TAASARSTRFIAKPSKKGGRQYGRQNRENTGLCGQNEGCCQKLLRRHREVCPRYQERAEEGRLALQGRRQDQHPGGAGGGSHRSCRYARSGCCLRRHPGPDHWRLKHLQETEADLKWKNSPMKPTGMSCIPIPATRIKWQRTFRPWWKTA